jgi:hypothetical protein
MANLNIRRTEKNHLDNWLLVNNHYYDFYLNPDATDGRVEGENCNTATIDPNLSEIDENGTIFSVEAWSEAVNTGIYLKDWGLCAVDNGEVIIDWKTDDLEDIFKNTLLTIPEEEKRFYMNPINGNYYCNPPIDYTLTYDESEGKKVINAQGGGLQGFWKLFLPKEIGGYETLPTRPNQCVSYEFMIKPEKTIKENTMSWYYPENFGIFFYQGMRAENKWWYYTNRINVENLNNIKQVLVENGECHLADLLNEEELRKPKSVFENLINNEGILLNTPNIIELKTNNKYLYMNRTCCGYRVQCCGDNSYIPEEIIFSYQKKNSKLNYYTLFNRATDGLTISKLHPVSGIGCCSYGFYEIWKKYQCNHILLYNVGDKPRQNLPPGFENIDIYDNEIDIYKDTYNNAMAFRITPEGAIGYRINVLNCGEDREEFPTKLIEEYSVNNIIKFNEWTNIIVQICYNQYISDVKCSTIGSRTGTITFYVNGKLKFVSKNFKEPMFHELNEHWSKQEGVAFNMSLMIGSQGLLETILSDNPEDYDKYVFPIEQGFCGNLCGLLAYFKMNNCRLSYNDVRQKIIIKNNFFIT